MIVPWDEFATLTRSRRRHDADLPARELIAEGTLADIVTMLAVIDPASRDELMISLPDRRTAPVRYEPEEFFDLLSRKGWPKARR